MRTALGTLALAPLAAALALACPACSDGGGLPTGSWHPHGETGNVGSNASGSSSGGSSSGGSSGASGGGSGSGAGSSSGGSSGASSGSSGGASGSGSGGSSGGAQAANVAVSVDKTSVQMQLLAQSVLHVTVAPNGYSGPITLSPGTLPAGITATFDHASLTLDGTTSQTAMLTVKTDTSTPAGTVLVAVSATAAGTTKTADVSVAVDSAITLHIPQGVNNMGGTVQNPIMTAYGPYPIQITAPAGLSSATPVTVYFMNDDGVSHEIHADAGGQGFGHDPGAFGANSMDPYVRKVNTAGTYDFYLHDQGQAITIGRIEIK